MVIAIGLVALAVLLTVGLFVVERVADAISSRNK